MLPGHDECCYRPVARWVGESLPHVPFSLREGYLPSWRSARFPEIARPLQPEAGERARDFARSVGLAVVE